MITNLKLENYPHIKWAGFFTRLFYAAILPMAFMVINLGCGGAVGPPGGAENRPPIGTALVPVNGQVLVTTTATTTVIRSASAPGDFIRSTEPVPEAILIYTAESGANGQTIFRTQADGQGRYSLKVPVGSRGVIRATKNNRELGAFLILSASGTTPVTKNITVESTVANLIRNEPQVAGLAVDHIEEMVRLGEAGILTQSVIDAFKNDTAISNSSEVIAKASEEVKVLSEDSEDACQIGQQWCVVVSRLKISGTSSYTRIMLRKVSQAVAGPVTEGTVGAGEFVVQWPTGNAVQEISQSTMLPEGSLRYKVKTADGQGRTKVVFLATNSSGISDTVVLFNLNLTGLPPTDPAVKATVPEQKLRGILVQKRTPARAGML